MRASRLHVLAQPTCPLAWEDGDLQQPGSQKHSFFLFFQILCWMFGEGKGGNPSMANVLFPPPPTLLLNASALLLPPAPLPSSGSMTLFSRTHRGLFFFFFGFSALAVVLLTVGNGEPGYRSGSQERGLGTQWRGRRGPLQVRWWKKDTGSPTLLSCLPVCCLHQATWCPSLLSRSSDAGTRGVQRSC
jgi:hypothetical protein